MSGNTFGKILKITTFGESHGKATGGVLEGFPAGFTLNSIELQAQVNRRSPGAASHSTKRKEADIVEFLSGIAGNKTLGTPIAFIVANKDARPSDYEKMKDIYRPSHADFTWEKKYGIYDHRGGGRSSARETVSRVVAGAMAMQYLESQGIKIVAYVKALGGIESRQPATIPTKAEVDTSPLRCLDKAAEAKMSALIEAVKKEKDSLGGIISCVVSGLPAGLGEPVFDKMQARLAAAMMSINAAKGFEYGGGFAAAAMKGSEHNDVFGAAGDGIAPLTNTAGGILGGITTGRDVFFNVAFKPVSSIGKKQKTVDNHGNTIDLEIGGRHDVTVVPRAVPIVEAMAALTIMDFLLLQKLNK